MKCIRNLKAEHVPTCMKKDLIVIYILYYVIDTNIKAL